MNDILEVSHSVEALLDGPARIAARQSVRGLARTDDTCLRDAAGRFQAALNTPVSAACADWGMSVDEVRAHIDCLTKIFAKVNNGDCAPLSEEVFIPASSNRERDRKIILARLGFTAVGGMTLEDIGLKHGITRERVRQLWVRFEKRAVNIRPPVPMISACVELVVDSSVPLEFHEWCARIPGSLRPVHPAELEALVSLGSYGWVEGVACSRVARTQFVHRHGADMAVIKQRLQLARLVASDMKWSGLLNTRVYVERTGIPEEALALSLALIDGLEAIPGAPEWMVLPSGGDLIKRRVAVMLSELGPLSAESIREGIGRDRRFQNALRRVGFPPSAVLFFALERQGFDVSPVDGLVRGFPGFDYRATGAEGILVRWLSDGRGPVTRGEMTAALARKGLSAAMAAVVIGNSPLIQKVVRGIYAARGVKVERLAVREALRREALETRAAATPIEVLNEPGKVVLEYPLSEYALGTTVSIPKGLVPRGTWRFRARTNTHELKVREAYVKGLAPVFRRAAEKGYASVRVTFWLADRQIKVTGRL